MWFSGDLQNANDNPISLRGRTGRLRAGFQWDTALTRMNERNQYRQVLIEYQQAKRSYYRYEDSVWQGLRSSLRNIRYNQYNFELQRYAVRIAAQQITINEDLRQIRESLNQASGPTAARDSVSALQDLLNAQNTFLGVWVFYEALRRNLDQDLGTIRVDSENIWVDPGQITSATYGFPGSAGGAYCPPCQDPISEVVAERLEIDTGDQQFLDQQGVDPRIIEPRAIEPLPLNTTLQDYVKP